MTSSFVSLSAILSRLLLTLMTVTLTAMPAANDTPTAVVVPFSVLASVVSIVNASLAVRIELPLISVPTALFEVLTATFAPTPTNVPKPPEPPDVSSETLSFVLTLSVFAETSELLIAVCTVDSRLLTATSAAKPALAGAIAAPIEYRSSLMSALLSAPILAVEPVPEVNSFASSIVV